MLRSSETFLFYYFLKHITKANLLIFYLYVNKSTLWHRNGVENKDETSTGKDTKRKNSAYSDVPNDM